MKSKGSRRYYDTRPSMCSSGIPIYLFRPRYLLYHNIVMNVTITSFLPLRRYSGDAMSNRRVAA